MSESWKMDKTYTGGESGRREMVSAKIIGRNQQVPATGKVIPIGEWQDKGIGVGAGNT